MQRRSLVLSLSLFVGTMIAGLTLRFAPLGIPPFLVKYGGSFFWAMLIYWLVSTMLPRVQIHLVSVLTAAIATSVEFFKLVRFPALDAFRLTLPGVLLLGRFFSVDDIVVYWLAILTAAIIDSKLRRAGAIQSHPVSASD